MAFCTKCGAAVSGDFCTSCGARVGTPTPPQSQAQRPVPPPVYQPPAHPAQAPGQSAPTGKKISPVLWIVGGCFGLIVIAGVIAISAGFFVANKARQAGLDPSLIQKNPGLAVAKMMVSANPDLEMVSVDEDRGIIRVREKKTGKTMTVNLEAAKEGRIEFQDENGEKIEFQASGGSDSGSLTVKGPKGSMQLGTGMKLPDWVPSYSGAQEIGSFGVTADTSKAGTLNFKTGDSADRVIAFYENALTGAGFAVEKTALNAPGQPAVTFLTAKDRSSNKSVQVTATTQAEGTAVGVMYENK